MAKKGPHRKPPILPYLDAHDDAQRRMALGENQRKCPVCKLYIWEEYYEAESDEKGEEADG